MNELIAVQKIAGWEKLKTLVLDSVSSPIYGRPRLPNAPSHLGSDSESRETWYRGCIGSETT